MCLRNHHSKKAKVPATWEDVPGHVANGEIGMIVNKAGKRGKPPTGLTVEFSTQQGVQYTFWDWELNGEGDCRRVAGARLCRDGAQEPGLAVQDHIRGGARSLRAAVAGASLYGAHATAGQSDRAEAGRGIDASRARVAIAI